METYKHNVKFKVSLSNGETFYEGKAPFEEIKGELSPFQRLIQYTVRNKCEITSLSLYVEKDGKTRTFNLPSAGKNPKFKEFTVQKEKPIDFQVYRKLAQDFNIVDKNITGSEVVEWYTVAEAIYPTYRLQLWVDEVNPDNCWVLAV